ncbi:hypothetical protein IWQ56_004537 [Coemansia nantahalensis]|nr:hypothetical protein IWQ56_004537 [Coemansia nantahalensis]
MEAHLFQFSLSTVPETSVGSAIRASLPPAAFLFLTSDLRCLRIEEPGGARALLGHSLVSVVNRSVSDFVCDHDWPRLQLALEAARLAPRRCLAPPPIDPGAFQDLPLARLIHPVPATSGDSTVRAHLRTQSGSYRLFDICVYAGTTPELGQAYVVCCITPFDLAGSTARRLDADSRAAGQAPLCVAADCYS